MKTDLITHQQNSMINPWVQQRSLVMEPINTHLSFVEPSKIRTLVVPIGKWRRRQFIEAIGRLRTYDEIRLLDITPIDSSLFTPQGYPQGRLLFNFLTAATEDGTDLFLYDFEPFRKTFVVIGLVNDASDPNENLKVLKEKYSTVISHNLIYSTTPTYSNSNVFRSAGFKDGLETIVCDIGKNFLLALSQYYSSYKHVTLRSPGAIGGNSVLKTSLTGQHVASTAVLSSSGLASKRLSSIEVTTNNIKRSASLKLSKSLTASENRIQQRSQGRQLKILGNFQLLSGRYMDALRNFTDAVTLLHKIKDYLWLGSALDGIAISFIMLTYLHVSFQIPQIVNLLCPTQILNSTSDANSPRNSTNFTPIGSPRDSSSSAISLSLIDADNVNIPLLIKTVSEKVLYYYELSLTENTDFAPEIVYAELLLKTLTFMVAAQGDSELTSEVLKYIVQGKFSRVRNRCDDPNEATFSKLEIYCFANKVFELQLKDMSTESQGKIYIILAQIYDALGFERKKAFVLRLLMVALISDPLDISWHPDYRTLLAEMLRLYGVAETDSDFDFNSTEYSWLTLQKKCLQLCLTVADRVGDNTYAARLSTLLISRYTHLMTRSEQQSLLKNYLKPLIISGHIEGYWDPFLLREIQLTRIETGSIATEGESIPMESHLQSFKDSNFNSPSFGNQDVFNPFKQLQAPKSNSMATPNTFKSIFLTKDKGVISCMVQNPFKFEIGITEVQFNSDILTFCELGKNDISIRNPFIVAAESIRMINLPLELKASTNHNWAKLDSLRLSIFGLPLQEFRIILSAGTANNGHQESERFTSEKVELKVLPEQPELEFLRTENMPNNSFMILHGTKKCLSVTMRNRSLSCPITYLNFSHITNVEKSIKPDYWKKLSFDDLYTMDKQLEWLKDSCFKILNAPSRIEPNETFTMDIKIDATSVPFQFNAFDLVVEYGMISNDGLCIYLKKLTIPFQVTLKRSIEVPNFELIPLNELPSAEVKSVDWIDYIMERQRENTNFKVNDYVLLLLDIRNSWLHGITAEITYGNFRSNLHLIEGHHTTRVIIPVKKLYLEEYNFHIKPIPKLVKGRQYLSSSLSMAQENEMRGKFWCRQHILSLLRCDWHLSANSSAVGSVDFGQFVEKFDSKMVSALYCHNSSFCHVSLRIDKNITAVGEKIRANIDVKPSGEFVRKTSLNGLSKNSELEILTLHIMIFDVASSKLLPRSNKRVLYSGTLTRQLSSLKSSQTHIELLPIEKGNYELTVCLSKQTDDNQTTLQSHFEPVSFTVN